MMKIHLQNFGPLHDFTFDLNNDFHVLYGKNNIGKSYAMSAIYLILKYTLQAEARSKFLNLYAKNSIIDKIINSISGSSDKKSNFEESYQELITMCLEEIFLSDLTHSYQHSYTGNFENLQSKFTNKPLCVSIDFPNRLSFAVSIQNQELAITSLTIPAKIYSDILTISKTTDFKDNSSLKKFKDEFIFKTNTFLSSIFFDFEQNFQAYFLPASRSGLYEAMSSFSSIFAELSKVRSFISSKIEIPTLPEPIADYFLNISTIKTQKQENIYQKFAHKIEQSLVNAEIIFNEDSKKLEYYNPEIQLKLNLSETSSMVSELAPMVAHLKYLMNHDEKKYKVIFIEEPEAHLHPEIQVLLTEIFSELTRHNVKIVMTTHSNYIFNKINNLVLQKATERNKMAVYHIVQTAQGSIVNPHAQPSESGIEDENFAETAEKLYQERFQILD